jgi:hypothetical protein
VTLPPVTSTTTVVSTVTDPPITICVPVGC